MIPEPSEFPQVDASLTITLLAIGFAIAVVGHLYRARLLIVVGLVTIFVAVIVVPTVALAVPWLTELQRLFMA